MLQRYGGYQRIDKHNEIRWLYKQAFIYLCTSIPPHAASSASTTAEMTFTQRWTFLVSDPSYLMVWKPFTNHCFCLSFSLSLSLSPTLSQTSCHKTSRPCRVVEWSSFRFQLTNWLQAIDRSLWNCSPPINECNFTGCVHFVDFLSWSLEWKPNFRAYLTIELISLVTFFNKLSLCAMIQ